MFTLLQICIFGYIFTILVFLLFLLLIYIDSIAKKKKTGENVYFFLSATTNSYLMHDVWASYILEIFLKSWQIWTEMFLSTRFL